MRLRVTGAPGGEAESAYEKSLLPLLEHQPNEWRWIALNPQRLPTLKSRILANCRVNAPPSHARRGGRDASILDR